MIARGPHGGYRQGAGKCLKGYVNNVFCDSTWEACVVLYFTDKGHSIKRCESVFKYKYKGKTHSYYPDFTVDGILLEVKGHVRDRDKAKWHAVRSASHRLLIIDQRRFNRIILPHILTKYCDRVKSRKDLSGIFDLPTSKRLTSKLLANKANNDLAEDLGLSKTSVRKIKRLMTCRRKELYDLCRTQLILIRWLRTTELAYSNASPTTAAATFASGHGYNTYSALQHMATNAFGMSLSRLLKSNVSNRKILSGYTWIDLSIESMKHIVKNSLTFSLGSL